MTSDVVHYWFFGRYHTNQGSPLQISASPFTRWHIKATSKNVAVQRAKLCSEAPSVREAGAVRPVPESEVK